MKIESNLKNIIYYYDIHASIWDAIFKNINNIVNNSVFDNLTKMNILYFQDDIK